jgi:ABC-type transporter Mla MlaB component
MADEVIDCGEMLTIADVGDLYARLLALVADGKSISFDCSKVERIDAAALQMILAVTKEAISQSNTVEFIEPSQTFLSNVAVLGLASKLNIAENNS